MSTARLRQILQEEYGLQVESIEAIERGYSNQSFRVATAETELVLRCGWPGKPSARAASEESVLSWLATHPGALHVPTVLPTVAGNAHVPWEGRTLHLFTTVPGEVLYRWDEACSDAHLDASIRALSELHERLRPLPLGAQAAPLQVYRDQLAALEEPGIVDRILTATELGLQLQRELPTFVAKARRIVDRAESTLPASSPLQWCHGDYQLENLLFVDDALMGLVDFDTVRVLPPGMDLAFALFNLTRDGSDEECFRWDRERWRRGAQSDGTDLAGQLTDEDWVRLYCVDQSLMHLRSGMDAVWALDEGIGFLPVFRGVLAA